MVFCKTESNATVGRSGEGDDFITIALYLRTIKLGYLKQGELIEKEVTTHDGIVFDLNRNNRYSIPETITSSVHVGSVTVEIQVNYFIHVICNTDHSVKI